MLFYVVVFVVIGAVIGFLVPSRVAGWIMLAIAVGWFFVWGIWALAAYVEMYVGYRCAAALIRGRN
jgi:hypothetical protein